MASDNDAPRMIGESASFLEMQEHVSHVAPLNKPVLIVGERGTGKELIAARLHFLSPRWQNTFLKLNCAAVSETLLEAQLFGHEAGAFTGASVQRKGYFERAHKGTLFLDELANTAMPVQEKILRIIEYGEFERLGGNQTIKVDVRLVAATNEDLPTLARAGKFRDDLLDRLAFDVITLPPLRHRAEDILVLAEHFAMGMVKELGREYFSGFSQQVAQQLLDYPWPGNVRELKNLIERAVYQSADEHIDALVFDPFDSPYRPASAASAGSDSVPVEAASGNSVVSKATPGRPSLPAAGMDFSQQVQDYEISLLRQALEHCQFNQRKTAEHLQLSYHQLRGYLRKYDLLG
ncbi:MAG: phage shock protein operon transcriptional activator [Pseudomonadales bacterium]|nr:phage shock protein operon transcriptional activator [Pseudomonadales bacterium]